MFMFKKRKKESVAIPFLLSMFFTLIIVGLPVSKYYNHLLDVKEASESDTIRPSFLPSEDNNNTLLFALKSEDSALRDSFMIVRAVATEQKLIFIPVSNNLLYGNKKMSDIYRSGGIIELNKAVEGTFDIKIDRYMDLSKDAFTVIGDVLGGVNYNVPDGLKGLNEGTQYLSSNFIITLISNKKLEEDVRTVTTASVMSEMFKQTSGSRVCDSLDYTFNKLINYVGPGTNITSIDYSNQKKALEYILDTQKVNATYKIPTCNKKDDGLTLDKDELKSLKSDTGI